MPTDPDEIAKRIAEINFKREEFGNVPEFVIQELADDISKAIAEARKEVETLEKMVLEYSGTTVPKLHLRIKELEAQLTTIRNQTIEEAARICETHRDEETVIHIKSSCVLCRTAETIRKLKG